MLTYQRGDNAIVERSVDPLGLVAKGSTWYLVAAVEGEARSYRVSRVQALKLTEQPFERPQPAELCEKVITLAQSVAALYATRKDPALSQ